MQNNDTFVRLYKMTHPFNTDNNSACTQIHTFFNDEKATVNTA